MIMIAKNIKWDLDADDIEAGVDLPNSIVIPEDVAEASNYDEDVIGDYISEQTGFCYTGCELIEKDIDKRLEDAIIKYVSEDDIAGIEDFLGYPVTNAVLEDLEGQIWAVLVQMPDEELVRFVSKYHLEDEYLVWDMRKWLGVSGNFANKKLVGYIRLLEKKLADEENAD